LDSASTIQAVGAGAFGVIIGWNLYWVNRYRTDGVGIGDLATLAGAIGGAAILDLFPAGTDLFAAYGIGLLIGFFAYFGVLVVLVSRSAAFDKNWFLDGRRKNPGTDEMVPKGTATTVHAMLAGNDEDTGG
jgi:hypothetical protein